MITRFFLVIVGVVWLADFQAAYGDQTQEHGSPKQHIRGVVRGVAALVTSERHPLLSIGGTCGSATVDEHGGFYLESASTPCQLWVWCRRGYASLPGPVITVPRRNDRVLSLVLPIEYEPAGLGFFPHETVGPALVIDEVLIDSPAWRGGLRIGDVVVAVDGMALTGLGWLEIKRLLNGKRGTEVRIRLQGEEKDRVLRREFLDFSYADPQGTLGPQ